MILISNSIPKSGSSYRFRCEKALLSMPSKKNGQNQIEELIKWAYVEKFTLKITLQLLYVNFFYGSFVIKTHSKPTFLIKMLCKFKIARASFSFRHPLDIMLSILDHYERSKNGIDQTRAFIDHSSYPITASKVKKYFDNYRIWSSIDHVILIRFEELIEDLEKYLLKLNQQLNLKLTPEAISELVDDMESKKSKMWNFNKGKTKRFLTDMTSEEIMLYTDIFKKELSELNY